MKTSFPLALIAAAVLSSACATARSNAADGLPPYAPASKELHDAIADMDRALFDAYNTCKLDKFEALLADDIEFFHDQGGLVTSKQVIVNAVKENICGKVTRELLPGSIEVYPINNYGAVQMGAHRFYVKPDKEPGRFSKFVHVWHNETGQWKLSRVISLH